MINEISDTKQKLIKYFYDNTCLTDFDFINDMFEEDAEKILEDLYRGSVQISF